MSNINELELETLRHLIGGHTTVANKLNTYVQQCQDPQLKQMLQQDAQAAQTTKQKFLSFLQ